MPFLRKWQQFSAGGARDDVEDVVQLMVKGTI